ncbi:MULTISPECIES: hypothetical protein [unclassified Mycobacterium]|uniref:hypothetical protein n=1 Tax=unclassified Mycobacterium TaxID=2642494 RepID=UPI000ADB0329|nr:MULTISPECIES: hypothetical protein [unclassified Mycobacterium]
MHGARRGLSKLTGFVALELYVVPGAGHVDLYDRVDLIPFDKLTEFFQDNLQPSP